MTDAFVKNIDCRLFLIKHTNDRPPIYMECTALEQLHWRDSIKEPHGAWITILCLLPNAIKVLGRIERGDSILMLHKPSGDPMVFCNDDVIVRLEGVKYLSYSVEDLVILEPSKSSMVGIRMNLSGTLIFNVEDQDVE